MFSKHGFKNVLKRVLYIGKTDFRIFCGMSDIIKMVGNILRNVLFIFWFEL